MKRAFLPAALLLLAAHGAYAQSVPTTASTGFTAWTTNPGAGTATFRNSPIGISLLETDYGAENINALCKTAPATPYTITGRFVITMSYALGVAFPAAGNGAGSGGFAWRNSTTGGIVTAGLQANAVQTPSVPAVGSVDFSTATTAGSAEWAAITWESDMQLQLSDDGTNVVMRYSTDGVTWLPGKTQAKSAAYLGATGYNQVCIFVSAHGGDNGVSLIAYSEASH